MADAVQELLNVFDRLTADARRKAAAEILRRTRDMELPPPDDETPALLAEETFLKYDAREAPGADQTR
jgi:hypothetical protein